MKKIAVLAVGCALAFGAGAEDVKFNYTATVNGAYDLSDAANYAKDPFYVDSAAELRASFAPKSPYEPIVFTATVDRVMHSMMFQSGSTDHEQTYIFDLGKDRTLSFNGGNDTALWIGGNSGKDGTFHFKSGNFVLRSGATGKNKSIRNNGGGNGGNAMKVYLDGPDATIGMSLSFGRMNSLFCVTNGATYKNTFVVAGGDTTTNQAIVVTGKGSVFDYTGNCFYVMDESNGKGDFLFLVNDGGVVTNMVGNFGNRGNNSHLLIDGGFYYGKGALTLGANTRVEPQNNKYHYPTNNFLEVANDSAFAMSASTLTVGSHGWDNHALVRDGSCADVGLLKVGGNADARDNRVVVGTNGTVRTWVSGVNIGASSSNNWVEVAGPGALLHSPSVAGKSNNIALNYGLGGNRLLVRDHGVVSNLCNNSSATVNGQAFVTDDGSWFNYNSIAIGTSAAVSNALLRVERGGMVETYLDTVKCIELGARAQTNCNSVLWVGDGGMVNCRYLRCMGYGQTIAVSNGTLNVGCGREGEFRTTYENDESKGGKTTMLFAGRKAKMRLTAKWCDLQREATFKFVVPPEGFDEVPFVNTLGIGIKGSCRLALDVEDYRTRGGGKQTLFHSDVGISVSEDQLATLREDLPQGCKLTLENDNKDLVLKVPGKGLMILFR